jgi:hypothetical protein
MEAWPDDPSSHGVEQSRGSAMACVTGGASLEREPKHGGGRGGKAEPGREQRWAAVGGAAGEVGRRQRA